MTGGPDILVAEYLLRQAREEICRLFFMNGNEGLEFSHLRLSLEAAGIKADHPHHWGSLSALISRRGPGQMTEITGRELAVAASRNAALNNVHRLTPELWSYTVNILAPKRGWQAPPKRGPQSEQVSLVER
jgi:hypothetical protein